VLDVDADAETGGADLRRGLRSSGSACAGQVGARNGLLTTDSSSSGVRSAMDLIAAGFWRCMLGFVVGVDDDDCFVWDEGRI